MGAARPTNLGLPSGPGLLQPTFLQLLLIHRHEPLHRLPSNSTVVDAVVTSDAAVQSPGEAGSRSRQRRSSPGGRGVSSTKGVAVKSGVEEWRNSGDHDGLDEEIRDLQRER